LYLYSPRYEDVLRFNVPVQYLPVVDVLHCPAQLHEVGQDRNLGHEPAALPVNLAVEITAVTVLHDDVERTEKRNRVIRFQKLFAASSMSQRKRIMLVQLG
jgi:hypothetical protein